MNWILILSCRFNRRIRTYHIGRGLHRIDRANLMGDLDIGYWSYRRILAGASSLFRPMVHRRRSCRNSDSTARDVHENFVCASTKVDGFVEKEGANNPIPNPSKIQIYWVAHADPEEDNPAPNPSKIQISWVANADPEADNPAPDLGEIHILRVLVVEHEIYISASGANRKVLVFSIAPIRKTLVAGVEVNSPTPVLHFQNTKAVFSQQLVRNKRVFCEMALSVCRL